MNLVKLLPTVFVATALSACSTVSDVASSTANAVGNAGSAVVDGAKTAGSAVKNTVMDAESTKVAYMCTVNGKKQAVSAAYTFEGEKPATASVMLGKKVLAKGLKVDATYTDGTQFTDGKNVWNLETITAANVAKANPVMFYVKGKAADQIIAKDCDVVAAK